MNWRRRTRQPERDGPVARFFDLWFHGRPAQTTKEPYRKGAALVRIPFADTMPITAIGLPLMARGSVSTAIA